MLIFWHEFIRSAPKIHMNKKISLLFLLVISLILPFTANAQGINVGAILGRIKTILFIIFDGIVVIMFVIAGLKYLTAKGDPGKVNDANKMLIWAMVGVAVGILANFASGIVNFFLFG